MGLSDGMHAGKSNHTCLGSADLDHSGGWGPFIYLVILQALTTCLLGGSRSPRYWGYSSGQDTVVTGNGDK